MLLSIQFQILIGLETHDFQLLRYPISSEMKFVPIYYYIYTSKKCSKIIFRPSKCGFCTTLYSSFYTVTLFTSCRFSIHTIKRRKLVTSECFHVSLTNCFYSGGTWRYTPSKWDWQQRSVQNKSPCVTVWDKLWESVPRVTEWTWDWSGMSLQKIDDVWSSTHLVDSLERYTFILKVAKGCFNG